MPRIKNILASRLNNSLLYGPSIRLRRLNFKDFDHFQCIRDLRAGDIVIDIGANIGTITSVFFSKGCTVFAYEPNPVAFKVLKRKFLLCWSVHLFNVAVSDFNGTSNLYFHEKYELDPVLYSSGSSLIKDKENVSPKDFVETTVVDISDILAKFEKVKIIKIDCEGTEYEIIAKIINDGLYEKFDFCLVETHHERNRILKDAADKSLELITKYGLENKFILDWH